MTRSPVSHNVRSGHPLTAQGLQARLQSLGSPEAAEFAARYFKTGPGEYGAGDVFLGIRAPVLRKLAREHRDLPWDEVVALLHCEFHEARLLALLILVATSKGDAAARGRVYDLYLANTRFINNWDLVDVSAPAIVGGFLADRSRKPLYRLARSANLWERRISIMATAHFIRHGDFADTITIAQRLLTDPEDLIHKAVGWMLREVGKRDQPTVERFLQQHGRVMPRTMLRYAIERFPEDQRQAYLKGTATRRGGS